MQLFPSRAPLIILLSTLNQSLFQALIVKFSCALPYISPCILNLHVNSFPFILSQQIPPQPQVSFRPPFFSSHAWVFSLISTAFLSQFLSRLQAVGGCTAAGKRSHLPFVFSPLSEFLPTICEKGVLQCLPQASAGRKDERRPQI